MAKQTVAALVAGIAASLSVSTAFAQTEITWWHAMGGELGTKLEEIVAGYNASQSTYKVTPVFKGTYPETMTAAIAAFRAGEQPDIVQVFEVGTGTMMAAEGAIYPVYQLMADTGQAFDPSAFLPAVVGYYTDTDGNMLSMPFNSSTPVLYYNKTVFEKAGLDPNAPPATWEDVEAYSKKIIESGAATCGFTTGWISLDPDREPLGLAQPADRHAGERFWRSRDRAHRQWSAAGQALDQPQALARRGHLPVRRATGRQRRAAEVLCAGMRHVHELLGVARGRPQQLQGL